MNCKTCIHRRQPGLAVSGYCAGRRDDLEPAYGINHPLRRLPKDVGASCEKFRRKE